MVLEILKVDMDRRNFFKATGGLTAVASCGALGCGQQQGARANGSTSPEQIAHFADLPGIRASQYPGLAGELALIEGEKHLPRQLDAALAVPKTSQPRSGSANDSPQAALGRVFPVLTRQLLAGQLADIYPKATFTLDPGKLQRARDLVHRYATAREGFAAALPASNSLFGVKASDGLLANLDFLDGLKSGCRLEALAVADLLVAGSPEKTLRHLKVMFQASNRLAAEKNLVTRMAAAQLRQEQLAVLEAVATHPQVTVEIRQELFQLVQQQLATFPADADAWVGDRATGLLVYEWVRAGEFLSLLEKSEVEELNSKGILKTTARAALEHVDEDQHFYLLAMRKLIASCNQPLFQREAVLQSLRSELRRREDHANYPLVAGKLLLSDFEQGHRQQGLDRAQLLSWQLALGLSLGEPKFSVDTNPLTGQPFSVEANPQFISVADIVPTRLAESGLGYGSAIMLSRLEPIATAKRAQGVKAQ